MTGAVNSYTRIAGAKKSSYCELAVTYTDGYHMNHLCKKCYKDFLVDFMKTYTKDEFDDELGEC